MYVLYNSFTTIFIPMDIQIKTSKRMLLVTHMQKKGLINLYRHIVFT